VPHEPLREPATKDEAFDLVRSLIEATRLVPEEGELPIEVKG